MNPAWPGAADVAREADVLAARLPPPLAPLARIAFNYAWSWTPGGAQLFHSIDPHRWELCGENPVRLLQEVRGASLGRAAADAGFVERVRTLERSLRADLERPPHPAWPEPDRPVVFLCAEYGVHPSLPIYAGGLGVLAGDILKEASDLAIPMVGVGLLYRQGPHHQRLDATGWQHEYWLETDPDRLPTVLVTDAEGNRLSVTFTLAGRKVEAQVWRLEVGRVPLYLLDTQLPSNARVDRWITARVYVGDRRIRLGQYALLGVGGIRALRALGIEPGLLHLNEGHAGLAPIELARDDLSRGIPFDEALARARARTVFTTHTPVPAGNEVYTRTEIMQMLDEYPAEVGISADDLLRLGRATPESHDDAFGLTPLALRVSRAANAVSRLHGRTARAMWQPLFSGASSADDVPITHVTNAVHLPTWMSSPMRSLLDRYLGEGWTSRAADPATWEAVEDVPDEELWAVRNRDRARLVEYVRDRSVLDRLARGEDVRYAESAAAAFDPGVLTLGFARRVAAYKRLYLLVQDRERAIRIMSAPMPFQLVIAGKSHPQDEGAKRILQGLFGLKWEPNVAEQVAFLEDYDLGMAEHLVRGSDVWVNLPRIPLEASGTSGMKSAFNGGLNLSTLDGWWEEAFDGANGWGIPGDPTGDLAGQDYRDGHAVYDLIEGNVLPLFYDRDDHGIPRGWIRMVKASLRTIGPRFCATRMMQDYLRTMYVAGTPEPGLDPAPRA